MTSLGIREHVHGYMRSGAEPIDGPITALETAQLLLKRLGIHCINYRTQAKGPTESDWQTLRLAGDELIERFRGRTNIGIMTGVASGNIVDVDLDCEEARWLANAFLPETGLMWGRPDKDDVQAPTHRVYRIDGEMDEAKNRFTFEDPQPAPGTKVTVIELRGSRHQSMCPPSIHPNGDQLAWYAFSEPASVTYDELCQAAKLITVTTVIARRWPERGARHTYVLEWAGTFAHRGLPEEDSVRIITLAGELAGDDDLDDREGAVRGTYAKFANGELVTGLPTLKERLDDATVTKLLKLLDLAQDRTVTGEEALQSGDGYHLTDIGNAERLVAAHGDHIHYVVKQGIWRVYDGRCWVEDDEGCQVNHFACEVLRTLAQFAAAIEDNDTRRIMLAWCATAENGFHLDTMVKRAREQPGIRVLPDAFDRHPMLFNCLNGVIDLRTGELLPHDPSYLFTKLAPVEYHPDAQSAAWDEFLIRVLPNEQTRAFVQRAVGYSLTGDVSEKVLFFLYGPSDTGKSTFLRAVGGALGEYAKSADFEETFIRRAMGGIRNDLARLAGARFVSSIEVEEGKKLAEGVIKSITGGDKLVVRFLRQEHFDYTPAFKPWLAANDRPDVSGTDDAMWRRMRQIPFTQKLTQNREELGDEAYEAALQQNKQKQQEVEGPETRSAILAWAVQGCLAWQRDGLGYPAEVQEATEDYRDEMLANDLALQFKADRLEVGADFYVSIRDVREAFDAYVDEKKKRYAISYGTLSKRLSKLGFKQKNTTRDGVHNRYWLGLRLKDEGPFYHISPDAAARREAREAEAAARLRENRVGG